LAGSFVEEPGKCKVNVDMPICKGNRWMSTKEAVLDRIHRSGAIGIFRVGFQEMCIPAMDALIRGGLDVFEVTMTTPGALEVVQEARARYGDRALVGVGTVIDAAGAEKSAVAGAQFIVSPSLHKEVLDVCASRGLVSCPGTFTTTEVVQAMKWGADIIKVFPISQVGPDYIKAIRGPLPDAKLVPTGGVDATNLGEYLSVGAFAVGVGGGLIPRNLRADEYDVLVKGAAQVVSAVKEARARK
jgi:2-dehydro-3-deoxyphosphogluconate aldolase / (4S)-4-hydroxy-2-oxoglutarate aldolase